MPPYLLLSDQGLGQMKWVKRWKVYITFLKPVWCLITRLMLFGWCKLETPGLKMKLKESWNAYFCMHDAKGSCFGGWLAFLWEAGDRSRQVVETCPSVTEYSLVRRCHCNAFRIVSFWLVCSDIIKVPQCSGFTRKNTQNLTPQPYRLYLIQPCISSIPAVQYSRVAHVLNANFIAPPSHMLWKMESATAMLRLLSSAQLSKRGGHLQVGRHRDVCLSRQSTSLPLLQLTSPLSGAKNWEFTAAIFLSRGACLRDAVFSQTPEV